MSFQIKNLPRVNGNIVRAFSVKTTVFYKKFISLRKGLTRVSAAKKLGITVEDLARLGIKIRIIKSGIEFEKLTVGLRGEEINSAISLRRNEERNSENLQNAVIGRLGKDKKTLEINIITALRNNSYEEKIILLTKYLNYLYPKDPFAQGEFVSNIVKMLYPNDTVQQVEFVNNLEKKLYFDSSIPLAKFVVGVVQKLNGNQNFQNSVLSDFAMMLFPENPPFQINFAVNTAKILYPDSIVSQGNLIGIMAEKLFSDEIDKEKEFICEAIKRLKINYSSQSEMAVSIAKTLYDESSLQREFLEDLATNLYPFGLSKRSKFVSNTAKILFPDFPISQGEFIGKLANSVPRYSRESFICRIVNELHPRVSSDQSKFVISVAQVLFDAPEFQGMFVGNIAKKLYPNLSAILLDFSIKIKELIYKTPRFIRKLPAETIESLGKAKYFLKELSEKIKQIPNEFISSVRKLYRSVVSSKNLLIDTTKLIYQNPKLLRKLPNKIARLLYYPFAFMMKSLIGAIKIVSHSLVFLIKLPFKIARFLYFNQISQRRFVNNLAKELYYDDPDSRAEFLAGIAEELQFYQKITIEALRNLYLYNPKLRDKLASNIVKGLYASPSSQGKFTAKITPELSDDHSFWEKFISNIAKELYQNDFNSQSVFIAITAKKLDLSPTALVNIMRIVNSSFEDQIDILNRISAILKLPPEKLIREI